METRQTEAQTTSHVTFYFLFLRRELLTKYLLENISPTVASAVQPPQHSWLWSYGKGRRRFEELERWNFMGTAIKFMKELKKRRKISFLATGKCISGVPYFILHLFLLKELRSKKWKIYHRKLIFAKFWRENSN